MLRLPVEIRDESLLRSCCWPGPKTGRTHFCKSKPKERNPCAFELPITAQLDATVKPFRERKLECDYPYLMLDALYLKVRVDGHVCSQAVVIAYAVNEHGLREVIGVDIVDTESRASWLEFMLGSKNAACAAFCW